MTALAADSQREKRGIGRVFHVPMKASTTIFKGGLVAIEAASGFAIPASDTAATPVIGVAIEKKVSGGANGDTIIRVMADAEWLFVASSITQAMLGTDMVVVDDNTVDDAAGATNDIVAGKLTEFVTTTKGWVYIKGLTT